MYDIVPDCNIFIMQCQNGTPERNAIMLCGQADFALQYGFLPYPGELFGHLIQCNHAAVVTL